MKSLSSRENVRRESERVWSRPPCSRTFFSPSFVFTCLLQVSTERDFYHRKHVLRLVFVKGPLCVTRVTLSLCSSVWPTARWSAHAPSTPTPCRCSPARRACGCAPRTSRRTTAPGAWGAGPAGTGVSAASAGLVAASAAGRPLLWAERLRRRGPRPRGLGRRVFTQAGLPVLRGGPRQFSLIVLFN